MKRLTFVALIAMLIVFPVVVSANSVALPGRTPVMVSAVGCASIPTITITDVVQDNTVTIQTANFPAGDTFDVHINFYGTLGIGGTIVETFDSGAGGTFTKTFTIPAVFHGQARIAIRLVSPTSGYYAYNWFYNNTSAGGTGISYAGYPTFGITAVTKDQDVTIKGLNFPANDTFNVRMNYYGTLGIAGVIVDTVDTGTGGEFAATYNIPAPLHGEYRIAIRLESPTSGYYAYNWFYNNSTASGSAGSGGGSTPSGYVGIPTFMITDVTQNQDVTIQANNFPANDTFNVLMNAYGTLGIGGILVDTVATGAGGDFSATYTIPAAYHGHTRIAIRLESPTTNYYAYNWFWNNTTGTTGGGGIPTSYFGYPTFSISAVTHDQAVTIQANNFPPNDTFTVRMNYYGTYGYAGTVIDTVQTGAGGGFTDTFAIPAIMQGEYKIAIRLESPTSGYYAYNWFYNNTTSPPAVVP
ncbi:MAG: hypothetical protein B5M51_09510 [Anaerolinea sp. 4484_236]|nr:MAG: hypothetical protein B5M51_09510 [Anaerolinea sp. 4484_236]